MSDDGSGSNSNRDDRDQRASAGRAAYFEWLRDATAQAASLESLFDVPADYPTASGALQRALEAARERLGGDEEEDGTVACHAP